jgi:hypothetical protein
MSKHKILKILGTFSPRELKRFGSYLRRTQAGKDTLLQLFDIIKKYHPDFNAPQLDHENLYRKILPDKAYHEKRIHNEMSDLRKAAEQFMIEEYLRKNAFLRNEILLNAYKDHQLDDLFFSQLEKMKKGVNEEEETSYTWLKMMKLAEEYYYHPSTQRITDKTTRIYETIEHLDRFYAIAKLQYACEALNRQNVLQDVPTEIRLLEEVQSLLNTDQSVCFRLYGLALKLLDKRDDATYWELKAYFKANFREIQAKDRLIIFNYLMNHIAFGVKKGTKAFDRESIDLYRFGVDHEILIVDGDVNIQTFENIVAIFCKEKEYEWTSRFIRKWGAYLKQEAREYVVAMSEAHLLFEQGKYREALDKIDQNQKLDYHNDIRANILIITCYVELEENHQTFLDKCDSFARNVQRNRVIGADTKKSVANFLKFVRKLDKPGLDKTSLIRELEDMKYIFARKWLREKVQSL